MPWSPAAASPQCSRAAAAVGVPPSGIRPPALVTEYLGSGSLRRYDRQITAPTVVIHGKEDILMRPAGGRAIASAIPGARLVMFDGMAHDLPDELFDAIITELNMTFAQFAEHH